MILALALIAYFVGLIAVIIVDPSNLRRHL